jgi:hypothetical protein
MGTVIANFTQLVGLFGGEAAGWAAAAALTPEDEALLSRAIAALEDAESEAEQAAPGGGSDVLLAANDQAAALLQTYLAEWALEEEKVDQAAAGDLRRASTAMTSVGCALPFPTSGRNSGGRNARRGHHFPTRS